MKILDRVIFLILKNIIIIENPQKTLLTALMTTYGFEHDLVEPIVKSKVKVLINNNKQ